MSLEPLTLKDYKFLRDYYNEKIERHENILHGLRILLDGVEKNIEELKPEQE